MEESGPGQLIVNQKEVYKNRAYGGEKNHVQKHIEPHSVCLCGPERAVDACIISIGSLSRDYGKQPPGALKIDVGV